MKTHFRTLPSLLALAILALAGCADEPTAPAGDAGGSARFEGSLDPANGSFVLRSLSTAQDGRIDLLGSNLVVDPAAGVVSLDVALRNASEGEVFAPAVVWLSDFRPGNVEVTNADTLDPRFEETGAEAVRFGFDYGSAFGSDGVLGPGETSEATAWSFRVPTSESFAFSARIALGSPRESVLGGSVFEDLDGDGVRDPGEPPFRGTVVVSRPDGSVERVEAGERGLYRVAVRHVGLHVVAYQPPRPDCRCEVVVTTPNPLEIVIVPDAQGQPQSYLEADFGARLLRPHDELPPILFTDDDPDQIQQDPYWLGAIALEGDVLSMQVRFGGCQPDHAFPLYMSGGFRESFPVQALLVLGHDSFDEHCDAAFERRLRFDLRPLREAYERAYGQRGPILLRLVDPNGEERELRYTWGGPRD